jgi:LDH2 family malate/lactate/ureidoglycolate dehydrogenase
MNCVADLSVFEQRVAQMALRLGFLARMSGCNHVRYPGELEQEERMKRLVHGIPIGLHVLADLNSLASEVSVSELQPLAD